MTYTHLHGTVTVTMLSYQWVSNNVIRYILIHVKEGGIRVIETNLLWSTENKPSTRSRELKYKTESKLCGDKNCN